MMSNLSEAHKYVRSLFIQGYHKTAVIFLRQQLRNKSEASNVTTILDLAFALYHDALKDLGKEGVSEKRRREIEREFDEAIAICRKIIDRGVEDVSEIDMINARIFLAQIYASLGQDIALTIAKETYSKYKSALTANRLADVYFRLSKIPEAKKWYLKYAWHADKEGTPKYLVNTDLALFHSNIGNQIRAQRFAELALAALPKSAEGNSLKEMLSKVLDGK